jgi:hypothetical protein
MYIYILNINIILIMEQKSFLKKKRKFKNSLCLKVNFLLYKLKVYKDVKENCREDQTQKLKKYNNNPPFKFIN